MAKMNYEQAWKDLKRQLIEWRFGIAYNDGLKDQDNLYLYRYYGNVIDAMDAAEECLEEVIEELPNDELKKDLLNRVSEEGIARTVDRWVKILDSEMYSVLDDVCGYDEDDHLSDTMSIPDSYFDAHSRIMGLASAIGDIVKIVESNQKTIQNVVIKKESFIDVEKIPPIFPCLCIDSYGQIFIPKNILTLTDARGWRKYAERPHMNFGSVNLGNGDDEEILYTERVIVGWIPIEEGDNDG